MKLSEALEIVLDEYGDLLEARGLDGSDFRREAFQLVQKLHITVIEVENEGRSFDEAERETSTEESGS